MGVQTLYYYAFSPHYFWYNCRRWKAYSKRMNTKIYFLKKYTSVRVLTDLSDIVARNCEWILTRTTDLTMLLEMEIVDIGTTANQILYQKFKTKISSRTVLPTLIDRVKKKTHIWFLRTWAMMMFLLSLRSLKSTI